MKISTLFYCSILFWSVAYGSEPECDLTIRDGNAAQDLDRVLHCFDQRLKAIEATISGSGKRAESKMVKAAPNQNANTNTVIREGIALTVKRISKSGDYVAVVVGIVNTNEYPIGAMLIEPWPSLVDDGGGEYAYKGVGGFIVCDADSQAPVVYSDTFDYCASHKNDWQYYKLLEPNNKVTAVFKFAPSSKTSSDGDQKMAFAANFMVRKMLKDQDKGTKPTQLNADIDIDLP